MKKLFLLLLATIKTSKSALYQIVKNEHSKLKPTYINGQKAFYSDQLNKITNIQSQPITLENGEEIQIHNNQLISSINQKNITDMNNHPTIVSFDSSNKVIIYDTYNQLYAGINTAITFSDEAIIYQNSMLPGNFNNQMMYNNGYQNSMLPGNFHNQMMFNNGYQNPILTCNNFNNQMMFKNQVAHPFGYNGILSNTPVITKRIHGYQTIC